MKFNVVIDIQYCIYLLTSQYIIVGKYKPAMQFFINKQEQRSRATYPNGHGVGREEHSTTFKYMTLSLNASKCNIFQWRFGDVWPWYDFWLRVMTWLIRWTKMSNNKMNLAKCMHLNVAYGGNLNHTWPYFRPFKWQIELNQGLRIGNLEHWPQLTFNLLVISYRLILTSLLPHT